MAIVAIRIGSSENMYQYDDTDYDSAVEVSAPIKAGSPVDPSDVLRLSDVPNGSIIDGDKLDIDWNPSAYTPDASAPEADDVDDLAAHLKGIDNLFATKVTGPVAATDEAITRYDGATGKIVQNSAATVDDNGTINIPTGQAYKVNNIQVVTDQQAAEADVAAVSAISLGAGSDSVDRTTFNTDLGTLVTEINAIKTKLNNLLAKLRTHGLIDT